MRRTRAHEERASFRCAVGRRVGSENLRKLLEEAVQAKAAVELSVLKANPARRLYERLGFRIVGENEQAYDMEFGA